MRASSKSIVGRAAMQLVVALIVVVGLRLTVAAGAEGDVVRVDLKTFTFKVRPEITELFGYNDGEEKLFYYTAGAGETMVKLPADGEYELAIKASCDPALNERAKFKVTLGGQPVGMETLLTADDEKEYKLSATAKKGEQKLSIEFTNDAYKENEYDRNFYVHSVTLKQVK